ncbi:msr8102 [Mesorhizobium japonicum MAFF 303099]|uniref:Msr8102 protein n=1 Tax=Mesorhizobium japonicum (strain LMG 29417 / CECT 9101 / MAFF 303099) TaxID=266835 RepID=Q983Z1_RHILO|nr:msr8102 [Mesorhizobium japonicum MAFF 303099]
MNSVRADEWDAVHTVHHLYDRPLKGIADYQGFPHAYMREWDIDQDDWADTLLLTGTASGNRLMAIENSSALFAPRQRQ